MTQKHLLAIVFLAVVVLGGIGAFLTHREAVKKDALTFSNTTGWGEYFASQRDTPTHFPPETYANISLPPPPKNSSRETAQELAELVADKKLRTPEEVAAIKAEAFPDTLIMGDYTVVEYMRGDLKGKKYPATAKLLEYGYIDAGIVAFQQKAKFDRPRPNVLEPDIDPVIPVPAHPAYPQGHSTQVHYLAYILSELVPDRRAEFFARADQISVNREIAGLHYPSDTRAGTALAKQVFDAQMQNAEFQSLLAAAKKEWGVK